MLFSIGCFYFASSRVEFKPKGWMADLSVHRHTLRVFAWVFAIAGLGLMIRDLGLEKGIFVSLILWPVLASFVILFVPFLQKTLTKK